VSAHSCLYEGVVRHRRHEPIADELRYPLFMAYLDLDELPQLFDSSLLFSARGPAPAWFRRRDHLGDPALPLARCVREPVGERPGSTPMGPVRLLTHLRYFGHCFNPVSFYYCHGDRGEGVRAVAAEVTNTPWGERHVYVLDDRHARDRGSARVLEGEHTKRLHVSPLMGMAQCYRWRVGEPGETLSLHIDSNDPRGTRTFDATLALRRREISPGELRRVLARYPLITVRILARIYGHALTLRLRGASYHPHPRGARAA
jgi:uncharacterized protein